MHEAWLIDDIWRLIADHLDHKDFAVLAQTCKALFPLAVSERWKTVTSFSGFLACLPPRHQSIALQPQDLERLDFYSSFVHNVILGPKYDDGSQPLRLPGQYNAVLEKQKREVRMRNAENTELIKKKKKVEERAKIKLEKKRARRRKRGLPEPEQAGKEQEAGGEMNLAELKTAIDEKNEEQEQVEKKMWGDLWAEIVKLRPQLQFLPNVRRIAIYSAACEYLTPLTGISGSYLQAIDLRILHGDEDEYVTKFLDELQDVSCLNYLMVRDGMDLIPKKVIARAPLKHLRIDPRITGSGWFDDNYYKTEPVPVGILNKTTLEHLTIGLTREWYAYPAPT